MKRRLPLVLLIITLMIPSVLSAENLWSYSLGFSATEYLWADGSPDIAWQEQPLGVDIRGAAVIKPTGFYFGDFINVSVPTVLLRNDLLAETVETYDSFHDLFSSLGLVFGYRWELKGGYGFYIGGGPAVTMMADFDSHLWLASGFALEFGIEFLRSKGIGVGFISRAVSTFDSVLIDLETASIKGDGFYSAPAPLSISLVLGISWTSIRD